ncbi:MAG: CoA-binding protein [Planctomycetota bacterium]
MSDEERIRAFLESGPWAVAGASTDRAKYGNKVLRAYLQDEREPVYPLNPRASEVEGLTAYPDLASLPATPRSLSVITPPPVTEALVAEAHAAGVQHVWMQPGAESDAAVAFCEEHGLGVIAGGPCLLVVLGYRE